MWEKERTVCHAGDRQRGDKVCKTRLSTSRSGSKEISQWCWGTRSPKPTIMFREAHREEREDMVITFIILLAETVDVPGESNEIDLCIEKKRQQEIT